MKRAIVLAAGALALFVATAAFAQYPANGSIGVYSDAAGTLCCITAAPFTQNTAYVYANLAGLSADGMTGAEFRLEFDPAPGPTYLIGWAVNPTAAATVGTNPFDFTPGVDPVPPAFEGYSVAWATCQTSDPNAGAGRVLLGTISIVSFSASSPALTVYAKRRSPPADPAKDCPALFLCDDPNFTEVCLTIAHGDPLLEGHEAVIFKAGINNPACGGVGFNCQPVAVQEKTWSTMKEMYR